jgi:hypothetical protein
LAVSLLTPVGAGAIEAPVTLSQAEYASRVTEARVLVERELANIDESTTAQSVAVSVRELIPDTATITFGEQTVALDNGTLVSVVARLDSARWPDVRKSVADELLGQLRSQEAALGEPGTPPSGDAALLKQILADEGVTKADESGQQLFDWLMEQVEKVLNWVAGALGTGPAKTSMRAIFYGLLVISAFVVAWIVFVIVRRLRAVVGRTAGDADTADDAVVSAAVGLPDDALAFADAEAGEGRHREAVRALFGGAARELVERGVVPRTRTRTNAELLGDVEIARPAVHEPLMALAGAFEPAWYGHVDPGADGYRDARVEYVGLTAVLEGDVE